MLKIRKTVLAATCMCVATVGTESAQGSLSERLGRAGSAKCAFQTMAVGDWDNRTAEARPELKPSTLKIAFDNINIDEGTARIVGQTGPSEIIVRFSSGTLHLLQSFTDGPLYVTSVFQDASTNSRFKAVHTRHEFTKVSLPGFTSRPEQYYGLCEID